MSDACLIANWVKNVHHHCKCSDGFVNVCLSRTYALEARMLFPNYLEEFRDARRIRGRKCSLRRQGAQIAMERGMNSIHANCGSLSGDQSLRVSKRPLNHVRCDLKNWRGNSGQT